MFRCRDPVKSEAELKKAGASQVVEFDFDKPGIISSYLFSFISYIIIYSSSIRLISQLFRTSRLFRVSLSRFYYLIIAVQRPLRRP